MSYSQFKISDLRHKFSIREEKANLFPNVAPLAPSAWLKETLALNADIPLLSEKAKSEWIIAPILTDVWKQCDKSFSIYSGVNLDADMENGLNGECDFILSAEPGKHYFLSSPIFTMVEAKKDDFVGGLPQCVAQMIGAKRFNETEGTSIPSIYGCVTDGMEWLFIKLELDKFYTDNRTYSTLELAELLGVLKFIVETSIHSKR